MASASTRARASARPTEVAAAVNEKVADEKPELEKPATQFRILNPEAMTYALHLEPVERLITIPREFTLRDLTMRRVLDEIDALRQLYFLELRRLTPSESVGQGDFYTRNPGYLDLGAKVGSVRALARQLVALIARYEDGSRPSDSDVAFGMDSLSLDTFTLWVVFDANKGPEKKTPARA